MASRSRVPWLAPLLLVAIAAPASAASYWTVLNNGTGVTDSNISVETPTTNYGSGVTATCRRVLSFEMRCLFRFDLTVFVPASATRILDAQLSLYPYTNQTPWWLESYRVTEAWTESQVTWNNRQSGTPWGTAGGSFAGQTGRQQFSAGARANISVAEAVAGHWNGTYPNYGFLLRNTSGGTNIGEFLTRDYISTIGKPWLYVLYVLPTANPQLGVPARTDFSINWSWINPASDPDFSYVQVFINGSFVQNTVANYYNASVTDPFNCRTISLRSVNSYGDVNASWSNRTDCSTNTIPPPPVTGLHVASGDWNYALWEWSNPSVSDFAGTDIFINGTFNTTFGSGATSFNATGFLQTAPHTVSVRARDNGSNVAENVTGQNVTPRCEVWTCTPYEVCPVSGTHSRSCVDARACGTTAFQPETTSACVPPDLTRVGSGNVTGFFSFLRSNLSNLSGIEFDNETPTTSVSELAALPNNTTPLGGLVPYFLSVTSTGMARNETILHLLVDRDFIDSRNLDPAQVRFYAYNATSASWAALETNFNPPETAHTIPAGKYHYHVTPSHFSLFAPQMGGELPPGAAPPAPPPAPVGYEPLPFVGSPPPSASPAAPGVAPRVPVEVPLPLLYGIAALGISVGFILLDRRLRRPRKQRKR